MGEATGSITVDSALPGMDSAEKEALVHVGHLCLSLYCNICIYVSIYIQYVIIEYIYIYNHVYTHYVKSQIRSTQHGQCYLRPLKRKEHN